MIGLLKKGREGCLKITDIYKPLPKDESEKLADRLEKYWDEEVLKQKPKLLRVICRMFAGSYMFLGFLTLIHHVIIRYANLNFIVQTKSFCVAERTRR